MASLDIWRKKICSLQEFFTREHTRLPEVEGILWLREGKKTWQKHYFVLRASGIYYTPKGKTKVNIPQSIVHSNTRNPQYI